MASVTLKWIWEITPEQVFQKNRFVRPTSTANLRQEFRSFKGAKTPLVGTEYTYQLAVTNQGRNEESKMLRAQHADLPDSGDVRSGVLIFKGTKIIASLILHGGYRKSPFKMVVNPDFREQGLAERLLVLWWSSVKHTYRTEGRQPMSWVAVGGLLNAYKTVVEKAIADGRAVPQAVRTELETQSEAAEVLRRAKAADPESGK